MGSKNALAPEAVSRPIHRQSSPPLVKLNPFDRTNDKTEVPAAFALFPKDITSPPKDFADRFFNVRRWTEMRRGGHFAAMEEPELLVKVIRAFANELYGNQPG